jgi:carbon-monoxide dehydrogenase large subunit
MRTDQPFRRNEDQRLVTGNGRYASDWRLPRQMYAAFVRSDRAHAAILTVDATAARDAPGVRLVLTGDDVREAGFGSLPCSLPYKGVGGEPLRVPPHPVLAQGRVRYVGEPVACVVATTAAEAQDAAAQLSVEYQDLAVVVTPAAATRPGAADIHAEVPGNVCFTYETGDARATDAAFAIAARTASVRLLHQRMVGNPMELRACTAAFDRATGVYSLYTCMQGVNALRAQLSLATGVPEDRLRIVAQDVGGGFGVRYNAYPEHCVLMLASQRLGEPVHWTATRSEVFLSDDQGRAVESGAEVALDSDGRFLAFRFALRCDMGAYLIATGPFINIKNPMDTMSGVYRVPALHARTQLVMTNTVPVAAYRGAGRPLASYMVERLVDEAAIATGIDRVELRRRNFVPRDGFPHQTPNAGIIDCGDFQGVLDEALEAADWHGFPARRRASEAAGKLRGIGLATYIEFSSPGFYPKDEVELRFTPDGQVLLHSATHSSGQGHETTFAQIVSDVLGIAPERIRHVPGDPDVRLIGSATGGSRSLFGVGSVFRLAAEAAAQAGVALAARRFGVKPEAVAFGAGVYRSGALQVTFADLVRETAGEGAHPLDQRVESKVGGNFPNGCHVAEVEIDPATGALQIERYTACDDAGTVVNHVVVEGQIHGGVVQGVGQALCEHAQYDAGSGQLLTGSFMDYAMPRAGIIRTFRTIDHPVPTATNPLGAKGVGEAGATGAPPTVMNAVLDALRPVGVLQFDAPATPARVWEAIDRARKKLPGSFA